MDIGEKFHAIAMKIQECLCEALNGPGMKGLCYCGLMLGTEDMPIGVMRCGENQNCGVAWVRPVQIYPSGSFPIPDAEVAPRQNGPLAMEIEVGIARCFPAVQKGTAYPDPDKVAAAFAQYMQDMRIARQAILCCLQSRNPLWADLTSAMGTWTPLPVDARASGGSWTAFVQ